MKPYRSLDVGKQKWIEKIRTRFSVDTYYLSLSIRSKMCSFFLATSGFAHCRALSFDEFVVLIL